MKDVYDLLAVRFGKTKNQILRACVDATPLPLSEESLEEKYAAAFVRVLGWEDSKTANIQGETK